MGVNSVSKLQYDTNMQALTHIHISGEEEAVSHKEEVTGSSAPQSLVFTAHHVPQYSCSREEIPAKENCNEEGGNLRRRNKKQGVEEIELMPKKKEESSSPQDKKSVKNPINWFGILVSPHLRTSQEHFINGKYYRSLIKCFLSLSCQYDLKINYTMLCLL